VDVDVVAEVVVDAEEVEHVAGLAPGAAAHPDRRDRRPAQEPQRDVRLWTCCSTMWSPDSSLKLTQLRVR
jgi:hypothetical protein